MSSPAKAKPIEQDTKNPTAGNLVPKSAKAKMQSDAIADPKETHGQVVDEAVEGTSSADSIEEVTTGAPVLGKDPSTFNRVYVNVMFTFAMVDPRMFNLKDDLSSVPLIAGDDSETVNLYSPFRKGGESKKKKKEAEEELVAEGILRHSLTSLLDITDHINNSNLVFVGKKSSAQASLRGSIETLRQQMENMLPFREDKVLTVLTEATAEGPAPAPEDVVEVKFGDIVKVRSWISSAGQDNEATTTQNAVINFIINSGAFYDSKDRSKYLNQVSNILKLVVANRGEDSNTNLILGVNLDPAYLQEPDVREMVNTLLDEQEFVLFTRNDLYSGDIGEWLPQNKASVDRDLLSDKGEILLVQVVNAEGSDEE